MKMKAAMVKMTSPHDKMMMQVELVQEWHLLHKFKSTREDVRKH